MSASLPPDLPDAFGSERLVIRVPRPGDGAVIHASIVESLAELRAFPASLPWAVAEPSVATSERFCSEGRADFLLGAAMPMLLFERESGEHVGNSGLHAIDWTVSKCEIGYWIRTRFAGRGLMTEAVRAIAGFAFERLAMRRVEALPDAGNRASCRVCERAGFDLEGVVRDDRADPDGTLHDSRLYAIVRAA